MDNTCLKRAGLLDRLADDQSWLLSAARPLAHGLRGCNVHDLVDETMRVALERVPETLALPAGSFRSYIRRLILTARRRLLYRTGARRRNGVFVYPEGPLEWADDPDDDGASHGVILASAPCDMRDPEQWIAEGLEALRAIDAPLVALLRAWCVAGGHGLDLDDDMVRVVAGDPWHAVGPASDLFRALYAGLRIDDARVITAAIFGMRAAEMPIWLRDARGRKHRRGTWAVRKTRACKRIVTDD